MVVLKVEVFLDYPLRSGGIFIYMAAIITGDWHNVNPSLPLV